MMRLRWRKTTAWTPSGYRLVGAVTAGGTLVVTCESKRASRGVRDAGGRVAGAMIIPVLNRLRSAEQSLDQWLALYRDRQLRRVGCALVREWQRSTSNAVVLEQSN